MKLLQLFQRYKSSIIIQYGSEYNELIKGSANCWSMNYNNRISIFRGFNNDSNELGTIRIYDLIESISYIMSSMGLNNLYPLDWGLNEDSTFNTIMNKI